MPDSFDYIRPASLSQALKHLSSDINDAIVVSGGTDVLIQLRYKSISPGKVIYVKDLEELNKIEEIPDFVRIGGAVTFSRIMRNEIIKRNFPSLAEAAKEVGSPQIRNIGTIAGNVQTASPAGDGLAALYSLDAAVELVSEKGSREVNIREFVVGPKKTIKSSDEIIKSFKIAKQHWDYDKFFKVGKRNALAISIVNGIIKINFDDSIKIKESRIVLGSVAPTPKRLERAEQFLVGRTCDKETIEGLKAIISDDISPISDIRGSSEYRRYIAAIKCGRLVESAKGGIY